MIILVSYDFSDDKTRTRFSHFLEKFGNRIQYSVFIIKNSPRIINIIITEIEHKYKKQFSKTDSVYIIKICEQCQKSMHKYGNAVYEDQDVIYFD